MMKLLIIMTLFKSMVMLHGTNNLPQIFPILNMNMGIFHIILLVSRYMVMDVNNVMMDIT